MTPLEAALILADKYQAAHSKCDIYLTDTECYAEQYGDGNAGEHEDFRDLEIAIDDAASGAPETAAERDRLRESNGAMLEVLREGAVSLENSLKRITLIDGGITDENEELYYLGIAALDNMTDLDPTTYTLTDRGRAALEATR